MASAPPTPHLQREAAALKGNVLVPFRDLVSLLHTRPGPLGGPAVAKSPMPELDSHPAAPTPGP